MAQILRGMGVPWPAHWSNHGTNQVAGVVATNSTALASANTRLAMIGKLYISGRPTSPKTLSSAGGSISFRTATCVWASGSSSISIGIQGVSTTAGPVTQPDGTWLVRTVLGGGATITTNAWITVPMALLSTNLSLGQDIAVVFDLTARGGSDSLVFTGNTPSTTPQFPVNNQYAASAWATTSPAHGPNVLITFDDGTLGSIDCTVPFTSIASEAYANADNPDERGVKFTVPWDCEVDGLFLTYGRASANAGGVLSLYRDPAGTPVAIASVTIDGNQGGTVNTVRQHIYHIGNPVRLESDTPYVVALRSSGTADFLLPAHTVANNTHLQVHPGGMETVKATRDNNTGAFSYTDTVAYPMGVRVCKLLPVTPRANFILGL